MPTRTRPNIPGEGLLKGLGVTLKNMVTPAVTRQYPHEKPDLAPRTRGVIALMEENCTVCMLCAKECPDWCIYIESHKERVPAAQEGGRERTRNQLDRFAIDFALCMYCGICVEVCPFDALFWSPEFEYSTYTIGELTHEKDKLREWMDTVPPPPQLEDGAAPPMEVDRALEQAEQARQAALEQARKEAAQRAAPQEQQAAAGAPTKEREEEDIEVEAKVDQETYDKLIEEGKSERVARARAKAAYVRKEKARIRSEREAAAAEEPSPAEASTSDAVQQEAPAEVVEEEAPAEVVEEEAPTAAAAPDTGEAEPEELDVEPGEIDQETYDKLIEEGKSERIARARAKAAAIRKAKARVRQDRQGGDGSDS